MIKFDIKEFPRICFIETTNICNGKCSYCPRRMMTREQRVMTLDEFKIVADKIKKANFKIQAMYSFGEPLTDDTLFEKYDYARDSDILDEMVWLSTNGSLLTKDKFDKILKSTKLIIISIPNVFNDFEKMTGLKWDVVYNNAIDFINYRNSKLPDYTIYINTPLVNGSAKGRVRDMFKSYNVTFVTCQGVEYGKYIKGCDHCDVKGGFLTIRSNGECTSCCFDINCENSFGNIFVDSFEKIKENWLKCDFKLCDRCDFHG